MLYPTFSDLVAYKYRKSKSSPSPSLVKSNLAGQHHSPFRGQGLEFDSVRQYVPGDDIRNIDWRVTARAGIPHLKIFKEERERHRLLCVDMNASMRFGTKNTFKSVQAAHAAALLGWEGLRQHDCVSACLFGDVAQGIELFEPKRSSHSFGRLLKALSTPVVHRQDIAIDEVLQPLIRATRTGSLVYFISDFMDLERKSHIEKRLVSLSQKCDVVFIAINDPADKSIFPMGPVFFSKNNEKVYVNTMSQSVRNNYASQWKKNRQFLYDLTKKCKVPLIELSTESFISRDLMAGLQTIALRTKKR